MSYYDFLGGRGIWASNVVDFNVFHVIIVDDITHIHEFLILFTYLKLTDLLYIIHKEMYIKTFYVST
jgi:hypothetical protein